MFIMLNVCVILLLNGCDSSVHAPELSDSDQTRIAAAGPNGVSYMQHANTDVAKAVRQSTARYHSTTQALKAGYEPDDHCVAHPTLGGMGYHWVNGDLIDPVYNPLEPEAVLYIDGMGNSLKLIALEYIVIDVGQPHPHFGDHPFDVGGVPPLMAAGVPHWSLHVWLYEENPAGMFTPFNPNISCN